MLIGCGVNRLRTCLATTGSRKTGMQLMAVNAFVRCSVSIAVNVSEGSGMDTERVMRY